MSHWNSISQIQEEMSLFFPTVKGGGTLKTKKKDDFAFQAPDWSIKSIKYLVS